MGHIAIAGIDHLDQVRCSMLLEQAQETGLPEIGLPEEIEESGGGKHSNRITHSVPAPRSVISNNSLNSI